MTTETRFPCPVCPGLKMEKVTLAALPPAHADLVLDHCTRCGGVWFEAGEVQQLRRTDAERLWREIVRREDPHVMQCHSCRSPLPREAESCEVCGWTVKLDCPTCARPLDVSEQSGMRLDYCRHCRGVWFDHVELAGIWRLELDTALAKRRGVAADGSVVLLDALLFDPFLMYYGLSAGAHVAGAAAEGLAHAAGGAGALGEVAGAAGEAAAGVFETIFEIIAGIFG